GTDLGGDYMARHDTTTNGARAQTTAGRDVRSAPDPLAALRSIPLFAHCTKRMLRRINALCARVDVGKGRVLCSEGAIGKECFIVLAGLACVTMRSERIKVVGPGDIVGEIALLTPSHLRTATVTATTPMSLLVFNRLEFDALLRTDPQIRAALLRDV